MNGIRLLHRNSLYVKQVGLKNLIYLFLLSNVTVTENVAYSTYSEVGLNSWFKNFTSEEIREALKELKASNYILIEGGEIIVGEYSDGATRFYADLENTDKAAIHELQDVIVKMINNFRKAKLTNTKSHALNKTEERILGTLTRVDKLIAYDFLDFFKDFWYIYSQSPYREFTGKERGLMATLHKLYVPIDLLRIIKDAILQQDDPTIVSIYNAKDKLFSKLKGKEKKAVEETYKRTVRDEKNEF